jgi:hypothetical protein
MFVLTGLLLLQSVAGCAAEVEGGAVPPAALAMPSAALVSMLPARTPVRLMVLNEVSTKTAKPGDRFPLVVDEPVIVGDRIVIPVNAKAWGEVSTASESGGAGKSGKLLARLLFVETAVGHVALDGSPASAGESGTVQTVLGVLALGPLGLFARGNNAKLKAGETLTGYVASDVDFGPKPLATP